MGTFKRVNVLLAGLLAIVQLFAGCAQNPGKEGDCTEPDGGAGAGQIQTDALPGAMGRYMEKEVWEADNIPVWEIWDGDGQIYAVKEMERDVKIDPDTLASDWHLGDDGWRAYRQLWQSHSVTDLAVAENGARMVTYYNREEGDSTGGYVRIFISSEGELSEWTGYFGEQDSTNIWYGQDGYFYVTGWEMSDSPGPENIVSRLYRVSADTGVAEYLWEIPGAVKYLAFSGDYLFVQVYSGLKIYRRSTGEQLPEDKVLTGLLQDVPAFGDSSYERNFLIAPSGQEDCIYVLTREGLYRHVMYGSVAECMIDGNLCSISDRDNRFQALWAREKAEELPVFFLAYGDGSVRCFAFDETMAAVPDKNLQVYSLWPDENIRQAVSAYRAKHPELYVQYEVGIQEGSSLTREDALKNLATRLSAGDGPDVLAMDGLPLDAYVEKGVLTDLTEFPGLAEGDYYGKAYQNYYRQGKLYVIPMSFKLLVLMGEAEKIEGVSELSGLADLLEESVEGGSMTLGLLKEENIMEAFGRLSCGGWMEEDGSLDQAAVGEYLALCRRIYLADRKGLSPEELAENLEKNSGEVIHDWAGMGLLNDRWYAGNRVLDNQTGGNRVPCAVGYLGPNTMEGLHYLQGILNVFGMDYAPLSVGGVSSVPSSLLAVSSTAGLPGEAQDFVSYALSEEFQKGAVLDGVPVNRAAMAILEIDPDKDKYEYGWPYYYNRIVGISVEEWLEVPVGWSSEEELTKWNQILEEAEGVGYCDQMVYDTVLELGAEAVNGEKSIEETVEAIGKKVQLHLAE